MARRNQQKKGLKISNKTILILLGVVTVCFLSVALSLKFLNTDKINEDAEPVISNNIQSENQQEAPDKDDETLSDDEIKEPLPAEGQSGDDNNNSEQKPQPEKGEEQAAAENESQDVAQEQQEEKISYSFPNKLRGTFLNVGEEFSVEGKTQEQIHQDIDKSFEKMKTLGINAVFVDVLSKNGTIYNAEGIKSISQYDVYKYIEDKAKSENIFVYAVYDLSIQPDGGGIVENDTITTTGIDKTIGIIKEFATNYSPNGIILSNYYSLNNNTGYEEYSKFGGGMGYENYQRENTLALVKNVRDAIRETAPQIPVAINADTVWANADENKEGTETSASFTSLYDGNADTKSFIEKELCDFVVTKNLTAIKDTAVPFESQVKWWSSVADEKDIPVFVCQSSKKAISGEALWKSPDEITRQALIIKSYSNVLGSVFDSLNALVDDKTGSTDLLMKFYEDKVKKEHILKDLAVTNPTKLTYTTFEPSVTFTGASDPNFDVTFNGTKVSTDQNGFFSISTELKEGNNKFTFSHKGKDVTYNITRKIELLKEISPTGNLSIDGNMQISITAEAIEGAKVWATINGQTIPMAVDDVKDDQNASHNTGESNFKKYIGYYETPNATNAVQKIGNIVVNAQWNGYQKSKQGAFVSVNKKPQLEDGVLVRVISNDAMTFPTNKLDNDSSPQNFPLAKGTMDYTVGSELVFKNGNNTYTYFNLSSGLRVYSKDITPVSNMKLIGNNKINGMTVTATNQNTDLILATEQNVPYVAKYDGNNFKITFEYTDSVPEGMSLSKNPLFSGATWDGATLKLKLKSSGVFLGVRMFYNEAGNLVFRFTNPPASISGARITVDPGHHINDPGAAGFNPYYNEQVINWQISTKTAELLEEAGANVNLIDTNSNAYTLDPRVASGRNFGSQLFISIHNNSAPSASAQGTEVYYFNDFSKSFASKSSANISSALGTNNRGAKFAHYIVTKIMQYPAVLTECGFLTNRDEYNKLIEEDYQWEIARGITSAAKSFFSSVSGNYGITGTESVGNTQSIGDTSSSDDTDDEDTNDKQNSSEIEDLYFTKGNIDLYVGDEYKLKYDVSPEDADTSDIIFESSDTDIATVNSKGIVKVISEGEVEITISTSDGEIKDYCTIYCEE
ncbi:MAG: N-acetylmuramoyl-L-alanine amidase [Oscillospiraceae bacterium]